MRNEEVCDLFVSSLAQDYVDFFIKGHEDETGNQIKCVYENVNERWEVREEEVATRRTRKVAKKKNETRRRSRKRPGLFQTARVAIQK